MEMTTGRGRQLAGRVYRGEGAARAPKWERHRSSLSWCPACGDYTEHDPQGCVECYDPELDEPAPGPESSAPEDGGDR
jgi:hypothetical protein